MYVTMKMKSVWLLYCSDRICQTNRIYFIQMIFIHISQIRNSFENIVLAQNSRVKCNCRHCCHVCWWPLCKARAKSPEIIFSTMHMTLGPHTSVRISWTIVVASFLIAFDKKIRFVYCCCYCCSEFAMKRMYATIWL